MTDYKNIRGKKIKFLTSDLSGEQSEGQLFYSDTDNDFKTVISTAAWSAGGSMVTATGFGTHSGPNTNSFYVGGLPVINTTQHYNGVIWSTGGNYPSSRYGLASAGTQTAGLGMAGEDGSDNKTNVSAAYDGSSWTAGPNINSARGQTGGTGTQTSALLAGGRGPGGAAMVTSFEEWNGTAWANLTAISQARGQHFMSGPETATFIAGGGTGNNAGSPITNLTEEFDGSSLSSGGNLNTARAQGGSSGNSGDGLVFAGASNEKNTEQYNGTSWTETSDMTATHRGCGNGAGSISNSRGAVVAGAYPAVGTTEEWHISINTITGAAWASGGAMNTGRSEGMTAGTQTASLMSGGIVPGSDAMTNNSEEYNGSAWSEGNNLSNFRRGGGNGAQGTQTAAFVSGGNGAGTSPAAGLLTTAEEYNGTSWSDGGDMPATKFSHGSLGTQTAGLAFSGQTGTNVNTDVTSVNTTYEYDGSSWTAGGNYGIANNNMGGFGTQTAGVGVGGNYPASAATYEYDGSSWTAGNNIPSARRGMGAFGTLTAGAICGGYNPSAGALSQTIKYDGTNWTESVNLATGRIGLGGSGTQASGLVAGGHPQLTTTEEYTVDTSTLNLKTLTDS